MPFGIAVLQFIFYLKIKEEDFREGYMKSISGRLRRQEKIKVGRIYRIGCEVEWRDTYNFCWGYRILNIYHASLQRYAGKR